MVRKHQNWRRHIDTDPLHFSETFGIKIPGQQDGRTAIQFDSNYCRHTVGGNRPNRVLTLRGTNPGPQDPRMKDAYAYSSTIKSPIRAHIEIGANINQPPLVAIGCHSEKVNEGFG